MTASLHGRQSSLPSKITPRLFVGSLGESDAPAEALQAQGIVQIINATAEWTNRHQEAPPSTTAAFTLRHVPVQDSALTRIDVHFDSVAKWVNEANGATLIHCFEGISRSATLGLACLMINDDYSFEHAIALMRAARPRIEPNPAFIKQLQRLELRLRNRRSGHASAKDPLDTPQDRVERLLALAKSSPNDIELILSSFQPLADEARDALVDTWHDRVTLEASVKSSMENYARREERDARARRILFFLLLDVGRRANGLGALKDRLIRLFESEKWHDVCIDAPLARTYAHDLLQDVRQLC